MEVDEKFYLFGGANYETVYRSFRHAALSGWKIGKGSRLFEIEKVKFTKGPWTSIKTQFYATTNFTETKKLHCGNT